MALDYHQLEDICILIVRSSPARRSTYGEMGTGDQPIVVTAASAANMAYTH